MNGFALGTAAVLLEICLCVDAAKLLFGPDGAGMSLIVTVPFAAWIGRLAANVEL